MKKTAASSLLARAFRLLLLTLCAKIAIGLMSQGIHVLLADASVTVRTVADVCTGIADVAAFFALAYALFHAAIELRVPPLAALVAVVMGAMIPWVFTLAVCAALARCVWLLRRELAGAFSIRRS